MSQDGEKTSDKGKMGARGAQVPVQDELDQEWGRTIGVLLGLVRRKQLLHQRGMQQKEVDELANPKAGQRQTAWASPPSIARPGAWLPDLGVP